ncbi:MAG: hypothetical protein JO089_09305 [Alphaproteobacteria bacterium]|nr:hypothetical protein [Alphaproteobacteria bacterium]
MPEDNALVRTSVQEVVESLQSPFQRMLEAGMLPRQIVAVVGVMLQNEAKGLYKTISTEEEFRRAAGVAYTQRDKMAPNTLGFRPTATMNEVRRTEPSEAQRQVVEDTLAPMFVELRKGIAGGTYDVPHLQAISMALLGASNGTHIGGLAPEDGAPYFAAMVEHSLQYILPEGSRARERITFRRLPGTGNDAGGGYEGR